MSIGLSGSRSLRALSEQRSVSLYLLVVRDQGCLVINRRSNQLPERKEATSPVRNQSPRLGPAGCRWFTTLVWTFSDRMEQPGAWGGQRALSRFSPGEEEQLGTELLALRCLWREGEWPGGGGGP